MVAPLYTGKSRAKRQATPGQQSGVRIAGRVAEEWVRIEGSSWIRKLARRVGLGPRDEDGASVGSRGSGGRVRAAFGTAEVKWHG